MIISIKSEILQLSNFKKRFEIKCFIILVLISSGLVFAKPTQQEQKVIEDAAAEIGINLSFDRMVNPDNVKQRCVENFKKLALGINKTPEIEPMAIEH